MQSMLLAILLKTYHGAPREPDTLVDEVYSTLRASQQAHQQINKTPQAACSLSFT